MAAVLLQEEVKVQMEAVRQGAVEMVVPPELLVPMDLAVKQLAEVIKTGKVISQ